MDNYTNIDLLFEASDIKKTPTLIKHCTVAVSRKKGGSRFRQWPGQSKQFGAFSMCRHVMSRPYHKGTKKGEPPFYKQGSSVGKVGDMKRTQRGTKRDFKHTFEKGGRKKTAQFDKYAKKFDKEYKDLLDKEKSVKGLVKRGSLQKSAWRRARRKEKEGAISGYLKRKLDKLLGRTTSKSGFKRGTK